MDASTIGKLVTLLALVALFIGAVVVTPRLWHVNDAEQQKRTSEAGRRMG
jgi:p-aminobenzoyl-glutamate transporter AbgT